MLASQCERRKSRSKLILSAEEKEYERESMDGGMVAMYHH